MKAKNIFLAALTTICAIAMTGSLSSCSDSDDDNNGVPPKPIFQITVNTPSGTTYVLKPYMEWTNTLTDIEKYMSENYPDWTDEHDGKLTADKYYPSQWNRSFCKGFMHNAYAFADDKGVEYKLVAYTFYGSTYVKNIQEQLTQFGYTYKGKLISDNFDADACYLYLSQDESIEAQISVWEKEGGRWSLSFQPLDKDDLQYLEKN